MSQTAFLRMNICEYTYVVETPRLKLQWRFSTNFIHLFLVSMHQSKEDPRRLLQGHRDRKRGWDLYWRVVALVYLGHERSQNRKLVWIVKIFIPDTFFRSTDPSSPSSLRKGRVVRGGGNQYIFQSRFRSRDPPWSSTLRKNKRKKEKEKKKKKKKKKGKKKHFTAEPNLALDLVPRPDQTH